MLKIEQKREERGLTRRELAEKVGASYASIRNYEKGYREPDIDMLARISEALGCTMNDLVERRPGPGVRRARFPERWFKSQREVHEKTGRSVVGVNIKTGQVVRFVCLLDCRAQGFHPSAVCHCCKGHRQTHKGYTWRFVNG